MVLGNVRGFVLVVFVLLVLVVCWCFSYIEGGVGGVVSIGFVNRVRLISIIVFMWVLFGY